MSREFEIVRENQVLHTTYLLVVCKYVGKSPPFEMGLPDLSLTTVFCAPAGPGAVLAATTTVAMMIAETAAGCHRRAGRRVAIR